MEQRNTFFLRRQFLACERHNLHDDLCLRDSPVISFDRESHLNVLLYRSDEFNNKINKEINFPYYTKQGRRHRGSRADAGLPIFLRCKKKETKWKKSFKAVTFKRLSPQWKCYSFSNVYCLILECLEFKYFSVFHHPYNLKFIWPALPNLVVALHRKLICPWSYNTKLHDLSEVRVGWHFLVRFISCNNFGFLVLFSSICFKHVNADIAKKKIWYSFVNSEIKV